MATPSYAAVAGGRSPPPSKRQGKILSLNQGDNEMNSPRRVFSIKSKADSTATAHPALKENGSTPDVAKPAQHHQKNGSMRLKKQQTPMASSASNPSVAESNKVAMPVQHKVPVLVQQENNNNATDSSQKEKPVQPIQPQKEVQQQQKSATMALTKAEKKKARKMLQQYYQDQNVAGPSSSVPKSTTVRDEDKSKAGMELVQAQNNASAAAAPVSSAADAHSSGSGKPVAQNGTNEEYPSLATLSGNALHYANICGENMDAIISRQQREITDYRLHSAKQSHEIAALLAKVDNLETLLALKGQTQVEERLRKLQVVELEGRIKQLETKCSSLEDEIGHLRPVLDAFRLVEKARGCRQAELQADNARLREMIRRGVVSIVDVWGHDAATTFSNIANGNMGGEKEPMGAPPTTPSTVPCSPRTSNLVNHFKLAPGALNPSSKSNISSLQKDDKAEVLAEEPRRSAEDSFVEGNRGTNSANNNENTSSFTSDLVLDKEDSIDHNISNNDGTAFDSAKFEARGTGSWADEVEEEVHQGQLQPPHDVSRVDEKAQHLPAVPQEPPRIFQQSPAYPDRRRFTGFKPPSGAQVSSFQSMASTSSGAAPGGSKPREENNQMPYREQKTANQSASSGRGDYAQKIQDLYVQRKRTKPYQHNNKPMNNNGNNPRVGNASRDDGPSEKKAEEDEEGWTSVKGRSKSGYQAKHMGNWRKQ